MQTCFAQPGLASHLLHGLPFFLIPLAVHSVVLGAVDMAVCMLQGMQGRLQQHEAVDEAQAQQIAVLQQWAMRLNGETACAMRLGVMHVWPAGAATGVWFKVVVCGDTDQAHSTTVNLSACWAILRDRLCPCL